MNSRDFRRIALALPESEESEHMDHPDFRVRGKIFATLEPGGEWGVVMLTPEQQKEFMHGASDVFVPASGAWGRRGCTRVRLEAVRAAVLAEALEVAWRNRAPKSLEK